MDRYLDRFYLVGWCLTLTTTTTTATSQWSCRYFKFSILHRNFIGIKKSKNIRNLKLKEKIFLRVKFSHKRVTSHCGNI